MLEFVIYVTKFPIYITSYCHFYYYHGSRLGLVSFFINQRGGLEHSRVYSSVAARDLLLTQIIDYLLIIAHKFGR